MSEAVLELDARAKVNLGLRVVGRRSDGYHEIESLFVPLDLCDRLRLEIHEGEAPEVGLTLAAAPGLPGKVPAGLRNLAARAAAAFLARAGLRARVAIRLEKRIPSPGGLGGGSSDAAAVLRALASHFAGALAPAELQALGLSLGADVPFFLGRDAAGPVPARVSGIGERVEPQGAVPALALALVHPGNALETARVYAEFDVGSALTGPGGAPTMPALQEPSVTDAGAGADRWRSPRWLSQLLANDLEPAARRLCPRIGAVREALAASGALAVGLSGSGPTLFGIFPDVPAAARALEGPALCGLTAGERAADGRAADGRATWMGIVRTVASPGRG